MFLILEYFRVLVGRVVGLLVKVVGLVVVDLLVVLVGSLL